MSQRDETSEDEFAPVTPGDMLKDDFLAEYRLSQNRLAKAVGISLNRIAEIVNNPRRILRYSEVDPDGETAGAAS